MSTNREKLLDTLDALSEALGNSDDQTPDEIKKELRAEGIDVDNKISRLIEAQQKIAMASRRGILDRAREQRLQADDTNQMVLGKFNGWSREQIMEKISAFLSSGIHQAAFAHRDLEGMGTEEMRSILEDLDMILTRNELKTRSDE